MYIIYMICKYNLKYLSKDMLKSKFRYKENMVRRE